jgi:hypothetical protein
MPPKAKESTELQVINLDNLNPALLPELATFKEIQLKVVAENPFVEIIDTASRELAKKHRTARVSARTSLQNQDKLISSKLNDAKTKVKGYIAELIAYTQPGEIEQQKEIDRDEAVLEEKRQEKARLEQQRVDNIKREINDYDASWKDTFSLMSFESIEKVSADFLESYTSYDLTILEEFEALFPAKIEELTQYLADKTSSLTEYENARLEKIRLEKEADELRIEKARLEELARIAEEAEAKAKKEREDFEKEKAEFAKQQAEAQAKLDADKKQKEQEEADRLAELNAIEVIETPIPETIKGIEVEDKAIELIQNLEILDTEETTVNVCTSLENERNTVNTISAELKLYPLTPDECILLKPTWEAIEKDFKSSAEKSYSKWLKDNYNPPTKL